MPITPLSSRDQKRQRASFVDWFVKEFMAEMHYLEEMARGNQQARKNGDDEAYERLFNLACGLASLVPIPGSVLAVIALPHLLNAGITLGKAAANTAMARRALEIARQPVKQAGKSLQEKATQQVTDTVKNTILGESPKTNSIVENDNLDMTALAVLVRWLGHQLARRYEHVLVERLSIQPGKAVIPLARLGARRAIAYLAEYPLPEEDHSARLAHLLAGVLSLKPVTWYQRPIKLLQQEETLEGRDEASDLTFKAEKVYTRGLWISTVDPTAPSQVYSTSTLKRAPNTKARGFNENSIAHPLAGSPVYGYTAGDTVPGTLTLNEAMYYPTNDKQDITAWHARRLLQPISQDDLIDYLRSGEVQSAKQDNRTATLSLSAFLHNAFPARFPAEAEICCQVDMTTSTFPADITLSAGNFQGVDFSGSTFQGDVSYANFSQARLYGCTFTDITSTKESHVDFSNASLGFSTLVRAHLQGNVTLTHTDLTCVDFSYAIFGKVDHVGASWHKAILEGVNYTALADAQKAEAALLADEQLKQRDILQDVHQKIQALDNQMDDLRQRQGVLSDEDRQRLETLLIEQINRLYFDSYATEKLDHSQRIARLTTEKLDRLRQAVLVDDVLKQMLDLYIPVQAALSRHSGQHFDLDDYAQRFLAPDNANKKVMLLMGNAGEGKSTFMLFIYKKLWSHYQSGDAVPIFISLPTMEKPATRLLPEYFGNKGFTTEEIDWLRTNQTFVFILDGYDEMNSTPNLYVTNQLENWRAKVIITCRSQYFSQGETYRDYFTPIQAGMRLSQTLQEVTTVPFNPTQIDAYIPQYLRIEWYKLDIALNAFQLNAGTAYFRCKNGQFFYQMDTTQGAEYSIQDTDFLSAGIDNDRIQAFFLTVAHLSTLSVQTNEEQLKYVKRMEPYKQDILRVLERRNHIDIALETQRSQDYLRTFELNALVATPFLLLIALRVMPAIVEKYPHLALGETKEIAQSELYGEFMQWWFRRGVIKALSNPNLILKRSCDLNAEFEKISKELAIEMKHADVMQVHYRTRDQRLGNVYGRNFDAYEIHAVTSAELAQVDVIEDEMQLIYVKDCPDQDQQWRIVARNNAGGLTYHPKTGWLTMTALEGRWSARKTSIDKHQEQVREKARALQYALKQLNQYTPETLPEELKNEVIFPAIVLGLTHPWEYFFNLDDEKVQTLLPGVPVQPTERGGYMFIHAEILTYLYTKAIIKESKLDMTSKEKRKPWDLPVAIAPAMAQHGVFPPPVPPANNPVIHQPIVPPAPPAAPPAQNKNTCRIS